MIALAAWFATRRAAVTNDVALLDRLAEAEKRTNVEQSDQFTLGQVTIDGTARHTILARPHSRLIWPLVVPPDAIVTFAGIQKVLTVKDGKAREQRIRTGRREGDHIEVVEGLSTGDVVILAPGDLGLDPPDV